MKEFEMTTLPLAVANLERAMAKLREFAASMGGAGEMAEYLSRRSPNAEIVAMARRLGVDTS